MRRLGYTAAVLGLFHTVALFIAFDAAAWLALRALPHDPVTHGVADGETLVSGLQAHLAPHFAAQHVACYNFGSGGYLSSQERIVFEEPLVGDAVPRLAIFVDGMNDLSFDEPLHSEPLRRYVKSPTATSIATLFGELPLVERLKARDPDQAERRSWPRWSWPGDSCTEGPTAVRVGLGRALPPLSA
jgi:hypothetical protein